MSIKRGYLKNPEWQDIRKVREISNNIQKRPKISISPKETSHAALKKMTRIGDVLWLPILFPHQTRKVIT